MPFRSPLRIWLGALLILSGLLPVPDSSYSNGDGVSAVRAAPEAPSFADIAPSPPTKLDKREQRKKKRSAPISIPIHRRSSRATKGKRTREVGAVEVARAVLERDAWRMRHYYGDQQGREEDGVGQKKGKEKRAGWETLPLTSYRGDALYYVSVQIGTPPQTIDLLVDTGSTDLWVASSTCTTCNQSLVMPYLDGSQSSFAFAESSTFLTSSRTARLSYADGSEITGSIVRDSISIGSYNVPNQTFILATQASSSFTIAGILGLAFPQLSRTNSTPWWLNVLDQFEEPEMSFFLTQWNNPGNGTDVVSPGGQFTLGGRNSTLYDGEIQFIPINDERWWTIPILSMTLNDIPTSPTTLSFPPSSAAVIDTGTTLFYGPQSVVEAFYDAIPGSIPAGTIDPQLDGFYAVPCSSRVNAAVRFSETVEMVFPATNLMWLSLERYRPDYCVASFVATNTLESFGKKKFISDPSSPSSPSPKYPAGPETDPNAFAPGDTPTWLIGDAFMKSVYTVFRKGDGTISDPASVGFAPIKGVDYRADGNVIIGVDGNGVYGGIGFAGGPVVIGGGATPTPTNVGVVQTNAAGQTVYVTVNAARRNSEGVIGGVLLGLAAGLLGVMVW